MYDFTNYLLSVTSYLTAVFAESDVEVEIYCLFSGKFITYPLDKATVTVGFKKFYFVPSDSGISGTLELKLTLFSERDLGAEEHTYILSVLIDALKDFDEFSINQVHIGSPSYDRTISALKTEIVLTVPFSL